MRLPVFAPPALAAVVFCATAQAQPLEDATVRYRDAPLSLGAQLAPVGGPVGIAGVAAEYSVLPELAWTGGVGVGRASMQWALGVRPRLLITPLAAISLTASYSHGSYETIGKLDFAGGLDSWVYANGSWINADVGVDLRFESGALLRPCLGASKLVHSAAPEHLGDPSVASSAPQRRPGLVYASITVGYAF